MTAPHSSDKDPDFKDTIELLFFAYRDFVADPDNLLTVQGLGRAHHRVLHFVGCNPGMNVAELLDILQVTKQSLARVLRELVDKGYIVQKPCPSDRRRRLLHLTAQGARFHAELIAPQIDRFRTVLADVGADNLDIWKKVTRQIISEAHRARVDVIIANSRKATLS